MNKELIRSIPFLSEKDDEFFVAHAATLMKHVSFDEDEYIYMKGSPIDEVYFVVEGWVGLVLDEREDFVYVKFKNRDWFGEIDYVVKNCDLKRDFTAKALTYTECYQLTKKDLAVLEENYKEIVDDFFAAACKRLLEANKFRTKAEQYLIR